MNPGQAIDTLIIGAGAAGLFCAAQGTGRTVLVDHAKAPGEKIRISGGGRCNFTNLHCDPSAFLSQNPHFCKSALSRFTQWDFLALVERHGIAWHEKALGQLFCDGRATQIVDMLVQMARAAGTDLRLQTSVTAVRRMPDGFSVDLQQDGTSHTLTCRHLVLATGGKSIPKMGATGFAYDTARALGLAVTETRPALVPLTFPDGRFRDLSGISLPVRATAAGAHFDAAVLFTHRGLSGPAILQISSYWREGQAIALDLDPTGVIYEALRALRARQGRIALKTALGHHLPARVVAHLAPFLWPGPQAPGNLADQSDDALQTLTARLRRFTLKPAGSEGYRTAEVTLGGIDTACLSSKTLEARTCPGLYVIGEAVDVTGWLGGYNFQWAWSSGWAAGRAIADRCR